MDDLAIHLTLAYFLVWWVLLSISVYFSFLFSIIIVYHILASMFVFAYSSWILKHCLFEEMLFLVRANDSSSGYRW